MPESFGGRNRVSGLVSHEDTGLGIGGLGIVFYDFDASKELFEAMTRGSALSEVGEETTTAAQRLVQILFGGGDEEDSQIPSVSGDRIGSVLSDSSGRFTIEFDDSAFRRNDAEDRPDLVLVVVAPDRPFGHKDEAAIPVGTPEFLRLLHVSWYPARNVGREEEISIRLSAKALDKQGVLGLNRDTEPTEFVAAVAGPSLHSKAIRGQLASALDVGGQVAKKQERRKKAAAFASNVTTRSAKRRTSGFFASPTADVEQVTKAARQEGIERLALNVSAGLTAPSAHLRLSDAELTALGVVDVAGLKDALSRGETVDLTLDTKLLSAAIQERLGGPVLERITDLRDDRTKTIAARLAQLDQPPDPPDPGGGGGGGGGEPPVLPVEEQLKNLVLAQVAELSPGAELDPLGQVAQVLKNLKELTPPASPADVTAFHDFTHLQIAFPDVWAEALDRDVSVFLERLFIEYEELGDDYEGGVSLLGVDNIDPDELGDLEDYVALMRDLGADIAAVGDASSVPMSVRDLFADDEDESRLTETWPLLSIDQQDELYELAITPPPPQVPRGRVARRRRPAPGFWGRIQEEIARRERQRRIQERLAAGEVSGRSAAALLAATISERIAGLTEDAGMRAAIDFYSMVRSDEAEQSDAVALTEDALLARAKAILANPEGRVSRVQKLLAGLAQRLSEPHAFQVFQKNSVNFGIMTTYRQEWVPQDYQVGELAAALPLAPGETRKYTKKHTVKKSKAEKVNDMFASTVADERTVTSRAVADIVEKANTASNFQQAVGTQAGGSLFGFNVSANSSTQFQTNQAAESQRVKKDYRESVRKSSQEYKNEHTSEISTENVDELDFSTASEISNPNNEITVTYLFYELERQYRVTERLQRLTPVVLVAQEVPNPADIDEDWLLAHEWILRRSLLDASFNDALDFVSEGLVADEVNLQSRKEAYETQRSIVEELTDNVATMTALQNTMRDSLVQTSEREQLARVAQSRAKKRRRFRILKKIFLPVPGKIASGASSLGFGSRGEDPATLEARRKALETRLEFLEGNLEDGRSRLLGANNALEQATEELTAAVEDSFTKRTLVSQLRLHVKDNILHYMQMIWSYEPPDQRFFRLYGVNVPVPVTEDTANVRLGPLMASYVSARHDARGRAVALTRPPPSVGFSWIENRRLHEIADLDKPLGFKGNYMMFPLRESVYITEYMSQDYIDDYLGIREPDPDADFTTDELLRYAEQWWHEPDTTDEDRERLRARVEARLTTPRIEDELIVVPTGQLFIEALKGEHALLEDFKHKHRGLDLLKVDEEIREARLENLRKATRLLQADPLLDDPDVDKSISVSGAVDSIDLDA